MEQGEEIRALTRRMAGEDADETVLGAMCDAAAAEVCARLREGVSPESLGESYTTAVGVLALSMYCAVARPEQLKSFRAGDVSVEYGDGEPGAEALRALAEQMLAGALRERGFGFRGVEG